VPPISAKGNVLVVSGLTATLVFAQYHVAKLQNWFRVGDFAFSCLINERLNVFALHSALSADFCVGGFHYALG
jgi:hypothetical protein